jgi:uncharacterized protein (DUF2236 family)
MTRTSSDVTTLSDFICEHALLLGAGSTVFYQLADKSTGLGVAEHSTTFQRPVDRLRTTLLYVYVMVLGTDDERAAIAQMVNKMHAPVRSDGRYSAFDPELQLWVAATLAYNGLFIHERVFGPLDQESREHVYRDSQVFGNALQVKPEMWPATLAAFEEYWEKKIQTLETDPAVQVYCQRLLAADYQPVAFRLTMGLQDLMTRGNLDPRVRDLLGLTWTPSDERRYQRFWRWFPAVYRRVPAPLRHLQARAVLWDTRRRLRRRVRVI